MGTRVQENGKARVAASVLWSLKLPGVEFRCVLAAGGVALDAKREGARWTRTAHRKTPKELFDYVTRVFDVGGRRPATAPESVMWAALKADAQALADVRTLRDYAASVAGETLGTAIQLCVSGNGEAWRVFVGELPLSPQSCEHSFEQAVALAAAWVREQAKGAKP